MGHGIKFKQPYDRKVRIVTSVVILLALALGVYLSFASSGSYLPGWFAVLVLAVLALVGLSIPRYVFLTTTALEIHCAVKFVSLPIKDIKSVRAVSVESMKRVWPVPFIGAYGVFGYFGYYFDFKQMKLIKVYSHSWGNFVMVEDIYDEVVVLGTNDQQAFVDSFHKTSRRQIINR